MQEVKVFTNTTPHELCIYNAVSSSKEFEDMVQDGDGNHYELVAIIPPVSRDHPVRLLKPNTTSISNNMINLVIPVIDNTPFERYLDTEGLLHRVDTIIIVSMVVAEFLKKNGYIGSLYVPDTGPGDMGAIRSKDGRIIGVQRLIHYK